MYRSVHNFGPCENISTYNHIIKWCLEDILGLREYNLNVTFCVLEDGCLGRFRKPNNIEISQHLDERQIIETLFHELRHYYQLVTDMFDFDFSNHTLITNDDNEDYEDYVKFRDDDIMKVFGLKLYQAYLNYPWELDSKKFAVETFSKYLELGTGEKYVSKCIC